MIKNIEQYEDILPQNIEVKISNAFDKYAKSNKNYMLEQEFSMFAEDFCEEYLGKDNILFKKLLDEEYFFVNAEKNEKHMNHENFERAYKELWILVNNMDADCGLEINWEL